MRNYPNSFFLFLFLWVPSLLIAATAQEFRDMGTALYQKGLYEKSAEYFKEAVQADPNDWQSYEDLGNAYTKMNDNADALDAYQKSLQINPNNTTLQTLVDNMKASGASNSAPSNPSDSQWEDSQPTTLVKTPSQSPDNNWQESQPTTVVKTLVIERPIRRRPRPQPIVYNDDLALMNHARGWVSLDLGYNWSNQADFFNGQTSFNNFVTQNPPYTGIATADHTGIEGGAELGFLLNPYTGIAIGVRGIQSNSFVSNLNLHNGGDFETVTIQPYVVPLTLDYYLFLPDHDGRFFLTAGVGYYFALAHTDDAFSYDITLGSPDTDEIAGDMNGGNIGFQFGIGREFEIGNHMGLRLFARGRYCKITNINGNFTDADGYYDNYGLIAFSNGTLGIDSTSNISANGEHYATLDYTGFDVGVGLTFF